MTGKSLILLVLGAIILLFTAVWIFTRPAIWEIWNLTGYGTLGATINGITAPIIGLGGAILVYISFLKQVEANERQFKLLNEQKKVESERSETQLNYNLLQQLKDDLMRFNNFSNEYDDRNPKRKNWWRFYDNYSSGKSPDESATLPIIRNIKYLNHEINDLLHRLRVTNLAFGEQNYLLLNKVITLFDMYLDDKYTAIVKHERNNASKWHEFTDLASAVSYTKNQIDVVQSLMNDINREQAKKRELEKPRFFESPQEPED